MTMKKSGRVELSPECCNKRWIHLFGHHTEQVGSVFRRLVVGACAGVMISFAMSSWSQEEEEDTAAALYAAIEGMREMQEEMLKSLQELGRASKAVSQEELTAMRGAEEDIKSTLNWAMTELTELEKRYQEALKNNPPAKD